MDLLLYTLFLDTIFTTYSRSPYTDPCTALHSLLSYFYVIFNYYHAHEDRGVLGYPTQDSICEIPLSKSENIFLENPPLIIFRY